MSLMDSCLQEKTPHVMLSNICFEKCKKPLNLGDNKYLGPFFLFSVIISIYIGFTFEILFHSRNVNWPLDPALLSACLVLGLDTEHSQAGVWGPRHVF